MSDDITTLAQRHYENFPVGSLFVWKKNIRRAIHLIYAFARTADDIADEGTASPEERLARLDAMHQKLHAALEGDVSDPFFTELATVMKEEDLRVKSFNELMTAFKADTANSTYKTFDDLLGYCKYSACPIGKLILLLYHNAYITTLRYSNHICNGLQLTNFIQDLSVDIPRNRLYIPLDDLDMCDVELEDLTHTKNPQNVRALIRVQAKRAQKELLEGKPLILLIPKGFRFELRLIWHGGMRMLKKIEQVNFDTRHVRPTLNWWDKVVIFLRAVFVVY